MSQPGPDVEPEEPELELKRVQGLLDVGRVEEARRRLARVLAAEPGNAHALCLLAACHDAAGDAAAALVAADRAVAAGPDGEWAHRLRANALLALGRPREAVVAAGEAVRLAPEGWAGYALLGAALYGLPRRRAARAAFRTARRLAPTEPGVYLCEGRVYHAAGAHRRARRLFRQALRLDPQSTLALESLGAMALAEGRFTAALRHVRAASATAPGEVAAVEYLDRALLGMLGWATVTLWATMTVLLFAQFPVAWLIAAAIVGAYAAWAWRGWRALPSGAGAGAVLWRRIGGDPRMLVRAVSAAVAAAVALGIGVTAAGLDHDDPPFAQLLALGGTIMLSGAAIAAVDWWRARPRDLAAIEAARAGTPTPTATIDLGSDAQAVTRLLAFRWFQAAILPAAVLFVPAIDETPDRPFRAVVGTVLLAGYGALARWLLLRVRDAPPATIARWRRRRALGLPIVELAWLALVVFMLGASYLPDGNALLTGILPVAAITALGFGALLHAGFAVAAGLRLLARLRRRGHRRRDATAAGRP